MAEDCNEKNVEFATDGMLRPTATPRPLSSETAKWLSSGGGVKSDIFARMLGNEPLASEFIREANLRKRKKLLKKMDESTKRTAVRMLSEAAGFSQETIALMWRVPHWKATIDRFLSAFADGTLLSEAAVEKIAREGC